MPIFIRTTYGLLLAAAVSVAGRPASAQATPVGLWQTIDDVDGKPAALVAIREAGGALIGVVTALLKDASPADSICGKCSGERKGQRIVGMQIIRGMHRDGDEWSGGEILDPESGKTYKAKMRLDDGGKKLVVRGYIGFSLFGRSQTWLRAPPTAHGTPPPR